MSILWYWHHHEAEQYIATFWATVIRVRPKEEWCTGMLGAAYAFHALCGTRKHDACHVCHQSRWHGSGPSTPLAWDCLRTDRARRSKQPTGAPLPLAYGLGSCTFFAGTMYLEGSPVTLPPLGQSYA
jgi:hypothetical protein